MKIFLTKYKWKIFFLILLLAIGIYFVPRQKAYYLDDDIKYFKEHYLSSILIWTGVVISLLIVLALFIRTKSVKDPLLSSLYTITFIAFFLFIFQDLFLAGALFINRQFKKETLEKKYLVNYLAGTDQTKSNFIPYDLSTRQISTDEKLVNKIYNQRFKQNDTLNK